MDSVETNSVPPAETAAIDAPAAPPAPGAAPASPAGGRIAPRYAFETPDLAVALPGRLDEVSGLTVLDGGRLGAIVDEEGDLFVIDPATGAVLDRRRFRKDGDYEGVEQAEGRVFVLRSDGRLYELEDWRADETDTDTKKTDLHGSCDAEGLAYDKAAGRLLVACKESAGKGLKGYRGIYAFDLATEEMTERPVYTIDLEALDALIRTDGFTQRLRSFLRETLNMSDFKPSALAVHPLTGRIWVLSSTLTSIVVLDRDGAIADVHLLDLTVLRQPEGIAFLPNGDLFIATEARGADPALLRFNVLP